MRIPVLDREDNSSMDYTQHNSMVDCFLEQGFTYFDTAYMYRSFKSGIALREALVKRHDRDSFTVAAKRPVVMQEGRGHGEDIQRAAGEDGSRIL